MTSTGTGGKAVAAPRRARTNKAASISHAACEVFGRDGYSRASIDTIAAEAGASTRTLYNHFPGGKEELFRTVVQWSSGQVRDAQLALLKRYLDVDRLPRAADLERDLLALARAWVGLMAEFRNHFSLVRHIYAEAGHVPAEVLDAWQEAGPRAVVRQFAVAMAALDAAELVDVRGDPAQAAAHFMTLTSTDIVHRSYWGISPLPPEETDRITAVGVQVFLRAYGR
ncbi:TetR/AcrR family transcriptional regulator [Streptomyces sp. NBC_01020]|uniref:TetR/AcrR family transcriptional regulator n=1 Tax=unclassified Streptomyces TaxID=2593676 RepID=UPI002E21BB03|nr:TetR/AcrR family transcriptional regulator [Streptomyces sp. NBC_01020]WSX69595.1 TetR/AcrR family transcriptional regulator [Streptomyces sp. NBC_00932]